MTDSHLSDRMPEVARCESEWTASETIHLRGCSRCGDEWQLIRVAAGASGDSAPPDLNLDLDRIAAGVVAATIHRADATVSRTSHPSHWLRYSLVGLAAAAALLVVLRLGIEPERSPSVGDGAMAIGLLPELDQLTSAELDGVLAEYDESGASVQPLGEIPRLGELTDGELNKLLSEVGG